MLTFILMNQFRGGLCWGCRINFTDPVESIDKRKNPSFASLLNDSEFECECEKKSESACSRSHSHSFLVGVAGFEPATLWSQTRCANRAALHPAATSVA